MNTTSKPPTLTTMILQRTSYESFELQGTQVDNIYLSLDPHERMLRFTPMLLINKEIIDRRFKSPKTKIL